MALGTDIRYQLQTVIGTAVDQKSAKQAVQFYDDMTKKIADSTREEFVSAFKEFGTILNNALTKLNIQPIDIGKMIELPNAQMFSQLGSEFGAKFAEGFKGAVSSGVEIVGNLDFSEELEKLKKEQQRLIKEREKLKDSFNVKTRTEKLNTFMPEEADELKVDGDIAKAAGKLLNDLTIMSDKIADMISEDKTETKEFIHTVLDAQEKLNDFYRMRQTLLKTKTPVSKELGESYGLSHRRFMDLMDDENAFPFSERGESITYSFEEISDEIADSTADLQIIDNQLRDIEQKIKDIAQASKNVGVGVIGNVAGEERDLEQARRRMQTKRGDAYYTKKVEELNELTRDESFHIQESLQKLKSQYDVAVAEEQGWEVEYQWLVKFVKKYEELQAKGSNKKTLAKFEGVYNSFMGQYPEAMSSLKELRDIVKNIPPSRTNSPASNTAPVVVEPEVKNPIDTTPEVTGGKDKIEIPVEPKVKDSDSSYTPGDILNDPRFANMFGTTSERDISTNVDEANQSLTEQSALLTDISKLTSYIDEEYLSAGKHLSDFLDDLQRNSGELDGELKEILSTLRLIDENGNITFDVKRNGEEGGGTTHNGALISDDFVLIERANYENVKNSKLPTSTKDAYSDGINVAQVLGYIKSKTTDAFFDIQSTAKGHNLFENGVLSPDVVNATEEQLEQLTRAFITARDYGFNIENGGSNIVYDKEKGFSFYDLEEMDSESSEFWNRLSEDEKKLYALEDLFSVFSGLNRDHTNFENDLNAKSFAERIKQLAIDKQMVSPNAQLDGRNYDDIFDDVFYTEDDDLTDWLNKLTQEAEIHKINTTAINAETQAQEKLNDTKAQTSDIDDDAEIIAKENGALEDKLELLRDIAEQYGNNISQKQRDSYEKLNQKDMDSGLTDREEERFWELGEQIDEADSALEEFGNTYDRIIVKLGNGKKIDILPDDKGLRTLAKIDEEYGESYNGAEIEDVYFERVQHEAIKTKQVVDGLNDSLDETKKLVQSGSGGTGDASSTDLKAAQTEAEGLRAQLEEAKQRARIAEDNAQYEHDLRIESDRFLEEYAGERFTAQLRADEAEAEAERLRKELASRPSLDTTPNAVTSDDATLKESASFENLEKQIKDITVAVNEKTQAFLTEQKVVKKVVDSELHSLGQLEKKLTNIKATLTGLLNNIKTGKSDIGVGLSNVVVNVSHADTQQNDLSPIIEAISRIQIQPTSITDVGNVLATEKTLNDIKTAIESINSKVQKGTRVETASSDTIKDNDKEMVLYEAEPDSKISGNGSHKPVEKIKTALTALLKYKTTLQEANQLSGDLEVGINNLYAELSQVSDKEELTIWNEHFKQFKNASSIIQTLVKDYQALGEVQARAAMETDATIKAQYLDNAQILQDRIDTKLIDVNVDDNRFEKVRQRAYNLTTYELQQKQELANVAQVEVEITKQLVSLYEQLGRARAKGEDTTGIRANIKSLRGGLSTVDYATDMKFKAATDRGFSAERIKVENKELQEQEAILKNLTNLYQKYGEFKVRAENADEGMATWYSNEAEKIEKRIIAETQKLNIVTDAMQDRFYDSYARGKDVAETDILKTLYAKDDKNKIQVDKTRNADILKLAKSYEQLGKLQAQFDATGNLETKYEIDSLQQVIDLEENRLGLTREQIAALETKRNLAKTDKKEALEVEQREKTRLHYIKEEEKAQKKLQQEAERAQKKKLQQDKQYAQKEAMFGKAGSAIGRAESTWMSGIALNEDANLPNSFDAQLDEYYTKLDALRKKQAEIKNSDGPVSEAQKQELIAQTVNVNKLTSEIGDLITEYQRLSGENATVIGTSGLGDTASIEAYKRQLTEAVMTATNGKAQIKGFDADTKTLNYTVKTGAHEFTEYAASVRHLDNSLVSVQGTTKRTETFLEGIQRKTKEIFMYFGGSSVIYQVFGEIKKGIQYIREIDSALVELRKVTDETEETYDKFLETASKTSAVLGSTVSDFTLATATFAKLGYDMMTASSMAEAAIVYQNVGDGIESADAAAESIISTMKGFNLQASESMLIVDKFNQVGNEFSITSKGIGDALQRSASALSEGGNSIDESIGLITAANSVVQDPTSVGTALKTLTLRLRGAKTELEEAGLEAEGMAETTSALQQKLLALTHGQVDIMLDEDTFKNSTQILREMADAWEDMTDIESAAALELMGGKRQANILSAIIQNFDMVEEVIESSSKSTGSALKENEVWLDSIEGKVSQFTNSVQTMWNNALDSDVVKGVVDLGTHLIKIVDTIGLIPSILTAIGLVKLVPWVLKLTMHTDTFSSALLSLLRPLAQIKGSGKTLSQIFAQTAADAMNASGGVATFSSYLKAAGATLKAFVSTPLGWFTIAAIAIGVLVSVVDAVTTSTKEWEEELDNLKSKIDDTKNEIDSLNSELETTRDRIEELLALPSLSLTEQEELKNLQLQNAELEHQLELQKALLKSQEKERLNTAKEWVGDVWQDGGSDTYTDRKYWVSSNGTIGEDNWLTPGVSAKEALDTAMPKYTQLTSEISGYEDIYKEALNQFNNDGKISDSLRQQMRDLAADYGHTNTDDALLSTFDTYIESNRTVLNRISDGVNMVLGDTLDIIQENDLSYALGDEDINSFLDEYYAQFDAWQVVQGLSNKSDVIANMFGATATEEVKELGTKLKEIANDENLSLDQQRTKIEGVINSLDKENSAYNALRETMETVGVSAGNIADYFVESASIDSSTISGIAAQYQKGIEVMKQFKATNNDVITIEGVEYDWDELFSENDAGEFEARTDTFGEILKDMDNETRETFMNLAESVANGQMSWDQAIEKFSLHSMQAVIKNMKTEMENLNKLVFKGLDDEISGIIDTFDEFSAALENVADSMDLLHTAQTQMNNSGQISVKTALELIASTDQWNQVLAIENGQIKLVDGAEQALIQTKLNAIKSNIELALQEVNTSLAMLDAGDAAITLSDKLGNWLMQQIERVKEGLAWLDGAAGALWDNLFHGGTNDVVSAGNAAAAKVAKSRANEISDLQRQKANLEAQKAMLEGIDTVDEFKNNYDYNKTPGDKYDSDDDDDRLEKLQEKYERKISNLDNQQTYLENEIERLEAENKGVSKSYYEEQIKLEEKKMTLLQQERTELTALLNSTAKGSDEWWETAQALWEVEHSIQESTLRTIEFRESIADLYKTAFEDLDKAHGDKDDLYSDRQAYIEKYMELLELQGQAKPASAYMGLIAEEEAKLANSMAELIDLRKVLADGMASGEIKEGDEHWIEMQSSIRETEAAILDSKVAIEQYKEELKSLQVEAFDMVREAFSNRNDYYTNQQDYIEGYIDYLEATGVDATPEMYEKLIAIEKEKRANNVADLVDARAGLAKIEAAGYTAADEEWVDANNRIVELEKGIQDCDIAMAQWQKTIREMDFEKFDQFAERVNSLNEELGNVYKLVEDEDVAFDDGTWTKEGITALSMLYHQMENNEKMIDEYGEELAKLEKQYKSGEISEKEYLERAEELKDAQWDLVHTNEDLKDSIVDINEARIDLIEEGINEEIDAYRELIELKQEELDAERD